MHDATETTFHGWSNGKHQTAITKGRGCILVNQSFALGCMQYSI